MVRREVAGEADAGVMELEATAAGERIKYCVRSGCGAIKEHPPAASSPTVAIIDRFLLMMLTGFRLKRICRESARWGCAADSRPDRESSATRRSVPPASGPACASSASPDSEAVAPTPGWISPAATPPAGRPRISGNWQSADPAWCPSDR